MQIAVVGSQGTTMNTSLTIADATEKPARRGSLALVGTLLAGSFGLAAGVALALLVVAALFSAR